jgi:hypothetical protein
MKPVIGITSSLENQIMTVHCNNSEVILRAGGSRSSFLTLWIRKPFVKWPNGWTVCC